MIRNIELIVILLIFSLVKNMHLNSNSQFDNSETFSINNSHNYLLEKLLNKDTIKIEKIKRGQLFLRKKQTYKYWFYPNEFVSFSKTPSGKEIDTIFGRILKPFNIALFDYNLHKEPVPPLRSIWLNTYYVPLDSISSWHNKHIIYGQFINLNNYNNGVLESYFTIHFNRKPTNEEFINLLKNHRLTEFAPRFRPEISFYNNNYETTIRFLEPKAVDFFKVCKLIEKLPFVDWVENYISTGEPKSLD